MRKVYIISAVRTPIGSFGGSLSKVSATALGSTAIKGAIEKANISPENIDEVFMGNVVSANLGQAPARQAALGAGVPKNVPCTTVNKVCASGMKAIMLGAQSIMLGQQDIVVAGGMESMSNAPYYVDKARWGYKYGSGKFIDGLEKDGLSDAYAQMAMGVAADKTANSEDISREEQDQFTIQSYQRSADTGERGYFENTIIPVRIPQRRGEDKIVATDEEYTRVKFDKIPDLRPVFTKDGTATAANSSTINDGAAALVLASEEKVKELGLKAVAQILSFADGAQEPMDFPTTPAITAPIAIERAGLSKDDIDYYEVNEAFAVVALAFMKRLNITNDQVNVFGGAVSLGHPLGASGARIVTTLNNVLHVKGGKYGCAAICNGGGGASAIVIERFD